MFFTIKSTVTWCVDSKYSFLLICYLLLHHVTAKMCSNDNKEDCDKYHCDIDHKTPHPPTDYLIRPGRSVFSHPCRCQPDWSVTFCNQTAYFEQAQRVSQTIFPTICICRKFSDNGGNCNQFITKCYRRANKKCSCCFNQPEEFCDHAVCTDGKPDFRDTNTTCVCHSKPSDYPVHICGRKAIKQANEVLLEKQKSSRTLFKLGALQISSTIACLFVITVLLLICLLTTFIVFSSRKRLRKMRESRTGTTPHNGADEALLHRSSNVPPRLTVEEALLYGKSDDEQIYLTTT